MQYIEINEKQLPFRFSLLDLRTLEAAVTPTVFNKIINGDSMTFGEQIDITVNVLLIGLNSGAKKTGTDQKATKEKVEALLEDKGMEFIETVMEVFSKAINSPKG
jgi:hypothetical protein